MKKYKENEEARENFEREKRSGATKKNTSLIIGKDTASAEEMAGPAPTAPAPAAATNYADMFNNGGPADLAIARKMGSTE
jgi:hypothetical protein